MAIDKILIVENGESKGNYHRISEVNIDFNRDQVHVFIDHYADESYREQEKQQLAEIESLKAKREKLESKKNKTKEDKTFLTIYTPQALNAMEIQKKSIGSSKYTFNMETELFDISAVYNKLNDLGEFKDSKVN